MDSTEVRPSARLHRMQRAAARKGFAIRTSGRPDPSAPDRRRYFLYRVPAPGDPARQHELVSSDEGLSIDEIDALLTRLAAPAARVARTPARATRPRSRCHGD